MCVSVYILLEHEEMTSNKKTNYKKLLKKKKKEKKTRGKTETQLPVTTVFFRRATHLCDLGQVVLSCSLFFI